MDRNFARALPKVLRHEGGYVNNPRDPGGATNKGVTIRTFRAFVKPGGTVQDLKNITDEQVATVYYRNYWSVVQAHELPSGVDYAVFDFAVNSGPARAAKYLQRIVGVEQDGRVGPKTIAAAEAMPAAEIINRLCDDRLAFMKRIKDKQGRRLWDTFGRGWTARVAGVRKDALEMVGDPADLEVVPVEVEIEKPVVPEVVEKEVRKETKWWGWLTMLVGGIGGFWKWFTEQEASSMIAFGAFAVLGLLILTFLGPRLGSSIRAIKRAVEG